MAVHCAMAVPVVRCAQVRLTCSAFSEHLRQHKLHVRHHQGRAERLAAHDLHLAGAAEFFSTQKALQGWWWQDSTRCLIIFGGAHSAGVRRPAEGPAREQQLSQ